MTKKKMILSGLLVVLTASLVAAFNRPYRWWPINEMSEQPIIKPFNGNILASPEGSVAVEDWDPAPDRMQFAAADNGVTNPFAGDAESVTQGEKLYNIYCISCHGKEMNDQPGYKTPVQEKGMPGLSIAAVSFRNDPYIFSTISHGSAIMQRYGFHLSPDERWHIVSYIRHLAEKTQ
ncbi:MAG: cytochrome c [Acidobacteria bacterium]|nr:cytochrome c [Acidobacteriota bacterium]MCB9397903.1 cytochrome c [Acidobacteriota bacterium]